MSVNKSVLLLLAGIAVVFASPVRADGFVDPAMQDRGDARAAWELEYESDGQEYQPIRGEGSGSAQVGSPIGGDPDGDGSIATKTVTTTETITRIPRPPVEKRVCDVTDTCDRLDTLRLIDEMQEKMAVLDAEKRLAEARGAKNKALCEEAKACAGIVSFDAAGITSSTTTASVASIYGAASTGYTADIIVNGSRVSVSEGDETPDGSTVLSITPNAVEVAAPRSGAKTRLPFAGGMAGQ
ncbi:hypothetical protein [Alcanivorax sp. 1008]|uniref:hypothetical protein n=1 Tax=Alcanivorax sp. 1008 TaxID=2816853 RepID=UPI001DA549D7|nr:hypothetical protein [Alcanivorax sp. 1008]MCC1496719.1 hypothetical protein [Alcanivorax sp. 1008]